MMPPCPEAEVTALAPSKWVSWSVGSSATEIRRNLIVLFQTTYHHVAQLTTVETSATKCNLNFALTLKPLA